MARPKKSLGLETASSASQEQSARAPIRLGGPIRLLKRERTDQVFDNNRPKAAGRFSRPEPAVHLSAQCAQKQRFEEIK